MALLVLGFSKKPKLMTSDYINEKQYKANISFVKQILNGKLGEIKKYLRDEMLKFSKLFNVARDIPAAFASSLCLIPRSALAALSMLGISIR